MLNALDRRKADDPHLTEAQHWFCFRSRRSDGVAEGSHTTRVERRSAEDSEGRGEIGDQIVGMLDSDRHPDRRVRYAEAITHGFRHA